MARLGDVATYVNGFAFKPEDWSSEGLPIIRIQDLTGNSYQANRYDGRCDAKYEVNPGDILISWSASLGVYVWQNEKALLNQHIFKVIFNKVEVDKSFFVHQVRNILDNAGTQAHGATMKHLTKPVFDALPFYLPDLPTQRRIAATLDKVSEGIALCKQMLADLDELVKSQFIEMFGDPVKNPMRWPSKPAKQLMTKIGSGATPKGGNSAYIDEGISLIRSMHGYHVFYRTPGLNFTDLLGVCCSTLILFGFCIRCACCLLIFRVEVRRILSILGSKQLLIHRRSVTLNLLSPSAAFLLLRFPEYNLRIWIYASLF